MATMQALTFYGPRDVRVEEVPRPEVEELRHAVSEARRQIPAIGTEGQRVNDVPWAAHQRGSVRAR